MKLYGKHCKGLNVTAIYGGASITDQANQVKRGAQIIVATPGRMKDMISRRLVDISKIEYAVLDEADEMLNMGFFEDITEILSYTPKEKSTWLFSATMPKEVSLIAKKFMDCKGRFYNVFFNVFNAYKANVIYLWRGLGLFMII